MNDLCDYLTGVYNRKGMSKIWSDRLEKNKYVQILFLDVDNFKIVNDVYGHKEGDKILVRVAGILREVTPENGAVIRLGGDEFVLMIPEEYSKDDMSMVAQKIMDEIEKGKVDDAALEIITVSIGIVRNADSSEGVDRLLSYGDAAMYFAKESGKNRYVFFEDYEELIRQERQMESSAPKALEEGEFHVVYYPVIHLQNDKLMRTVAKTIWITDTGEEWSRFEYEHVLEKSGFLKYVDEYSIVKVCEDFKTINAADLREIIIGIRVSQILLEENIADTLYKIMQEHDVPPERIEFMIDERMFGKRSVKRLIATLAELKKIGFKIGIMNFGADFSSFSYLNNMPFSSVFFDGDLIETKYQNESGSGILKTLFNMTKNLHMLSVGQCVDTSDKAETLIFNNCDAASGLYFSRSLPLEEYVEFLKGITERETEYIYEFKHDYKTCDGRYEGEVIGSGVHFVNGISDKWGGLRFTGGPVETNLLRLPRALFTGGSFTVTMWLKPHEIQNWISAFFLRMQTGFASLMPTISGNLCMFRMHTDNDDSWTDAMAAAIPVGKWSYVAIVYDSFSATARLFIDGEFAAMHSNIKDMGSVSTVYLGGDSYQVSYNGDISALHIYDTVKSNDEIRELYMEYKEEHNFHGDDDVEGKTEYMVHDPAVYEDPVTGKFYLYCTGGRGLVSDDLEHWNELGVIVDGVSEDARQWTGSDAIWAPDIVKVGNEYRLYCSNSSWGVQRSAIFLAVSDKASGPFTPKQAVIKTDDTLMVNGIDANIIEDHETGEQYMLYGSFWDGIYILQLDKDTGLAKERGGDGNGVGSIRLCKNYREGMHISEMDEETRRKRMGICLARRPGWTSGAIEGPYMIYHPETKYYYLFVSYGSLKNDYNIRVGRSRNITGPFVDYYGKNMADSDDDDCTRGLMISAGYRWLSGTPYMGPGHNSVLLRDNGDMYIVSHIRKMQFVEEDPGAGLLQIRKLYVTPDDWIIAGSQPYAKETFPIAIDPVIPGLYERIELKPTMPQGICHAHPLRLYEDGRLECCSIVGEWKRLDDYTLEFLYGPIREYVHIESGLDDDNNKTSVLLSGLTNKGICTWAKKR